MKENIYLRRFKILGRVSLLLTTILMLSYTIISTIDAKSINKSIDTVKNMITSVFKEKEVAPSKITAKLSDNTSTLYFNQSKQISLSFVPANADQEVTYEVDNQHCQIDENGNITYMSSEDKNFDIKVTSKRNKNIFTELNVRGVGLHPDNPHIDHFFIEFYEKGEKLHSLADIITGKQYNFKIFASMKNENLKDYFLTALDNQIAINVTIKVKSDKKIIQVDNTNSITFVEGGLNNLAFNFAGSEKSFTYQISPISSGNTYIPTTHLIPKINMIDQITKIDESTYQAVMNEKLKNIVVTAQEDSLYNTSSVSILDEASQSIMKQSGNYFTRTANEGTAKIYLKSLLNEQLVTTLYIKYIPTIPNEIIVDCNKRISIFDRIFKISTYFDKDFIGNKGVKIEIIKGNNNLKFKEGTTEIVYSYLGKATIRVTSLEFPELRKDINVSVVIVNTLSAFVGKILGHLLTFFCLGLGLACTFFLLSRPRKISFIYALLVIVSFSFLTELLQSTIFHNNRGASLIDVFLNTIWGILGISIFFLIALIYLFILKKKHSDRYELLLSECKSLSFKTVFKRTKK